LPDQQRGALCAAAEQAGHRRNRGVPAVSRCRDRRPAASETVLALGAIAHQSVLTAFGLRRAAYPFRHGALHELPDGLVLADSYHCSRLNRNTGTLTPEMFEAVFAALANRPGTQL